MKKIYIIAHSENMGTPVISTFYSNEKAVRHVGEIVSGEYDVKPDPQKDVTEYIQEYYTWAREENDNMCEVTLDIEIMLIAQSPKMLKFIKEVNEQMQDIASTPNRRMSFLEQSWLLATDEILKELKN